MAIKLVVDQEVFNPIYLKHMITNERRVQVYFGGSASGKSYSLAQRVVLDIMKGERNYLVVRQVRATINRSVYNEIVKIINKFKLMDYFAINKSDMTITCRLNNKQILFSGLDDVEKIKSITPAEGVITDIWIEEATEIDYNDYKQLTKRQRGVSTVPKRMTLSFNPILQDHWIFEEFFDIWEDDKQFVSNNRLSILKTTYKDNKFLTREDIEDLESEVDPYYYNVYTLGNWGVLGAVIFKNWEVREFDPDNFESYVDGIDWGFSDDPFAYVQAHLERQTNTIYITDEICAAGLLNKESADLVREKIDGRTAVCDSATPQNIAEFNNLGISSIGARKGKGSVESGINWLKQFNIVIHPRCVSMKSEISRYKYKEDRNGNVLPIPLDRDNHLIDALRYAFEDTMNLRTVRVRDRRSIGL